MMIYIRELCFGALSVAALLASGCGNGGIRPRAGSKMEMEVVLHAYNEWNVTRVSWDGALGWRNEDYHSISPAEAGTLVRRPDGTSSLLIELFAYDGASLADVSKNIASLRDAVLASRRRPDRLTIYVVSMDYRKLVAERTPNAANVSTH